ncbi:hypothetical protein IFM89_027909 [Coptis chinensis]|uniref:Uncharacterized protein n=1 Tax=Coptis chinensis TaxID=261450 RepID=A0A835HDH8_9MAGN|nr:hypothetical protein IFM89_027909 [Coptis chinensis]
MYHFFSVVAWFSDKIWLDPSPMNTLLLSDILKIFNVTFIITKYGLVVNHLPHDFEFIYTGLLTSLVIDSGDGVTHVVPVVDGYSFPHLTKRMNVAGKHITSYLVDLLCEEGCCFGSGGEPSYKKSLNHVKVSLSRGGTSHLRRHAESCVTRTLTKKGQTIIGRTENGVVYSFKFNQIIARRETVRYFVVEELPFVKVEKPTFHRWIKMAFGPQFKPPCRSTMRSDVMLSFQEEWFALKDILRSVLGKVCLTSDLWTSN